ncbi:hypothetical protein BV509_18595 [Rhodovulum sulfidophilum]|uniref:Copper oxidase n=1 Tax=Rhodovulum visakhapatnamense TaxID=364297 RepID=A0ABS1RBH7_9RHOB|nr:plastocyanin/azurin family copper-binding protein [Rhodovulum visakhapatnamense]MBL3569031.1 copper oxidase [Rhodovulum visakhapatnamense]MBL3576993.1 copper oxidase [Rhodovulum visakhapatnamense]OLS46161.1 hypothetical protein BV509_18595 [Rhodovulum sulfidophilum]
MKSLLVATALALASTMAVADGNVSGHGHGQTSIGQPGSAAEADRSVTIRMVETADGMGFEPAALDVKQGETIRFEVENTGRMDHEIVLGTVEGNRAHMRKMAEMGPMRHRDPNALQLAPGKAGELVWTFSEPGSVQVACLLMGHMEAGMHGTITVN